MEKMISGIIVEENSLKIHVPYQEHPVQSSHSQCQGQKWPHQVEGSWGFEPELWQWLLSVSDHRTTVLLSLLQVSHISEIKRYLIFKLYGMRLNISFLI